MAGDSNQPAAEEPSLSAFERRVMEHQAGLRAYVRALGVDEAWVDDVAQEVFLIAYRKQSEFEAERDFGKWLRGIARHLAANERRKRGRQERLLNEAVAEVLLEAAPEREVFAEAQERERVIGTMRSCVEALPERSRQLLDARYGQGANATQLSSRFGMKAEAVRQTLLRVRALVRDCLEKRLGEALP